MSQHFFSPAELRPCPRLAILKETHRLTLYREGPGRDLTDVEANVAVAAVDYDCRYDDPNLNAGLDIFIRLERGPAAQSENFQIPYYVAILDPDRQVLAKRVFTAEIKLEAGAEAVEVVEEIDQRIPLSQNRQGPELDIYVGLHLTAEQLQEQRKIRARR